MLTSLRRHLGERADRRTHERLTAELHHDQDPYWQDVRRLLAEHGLDPQTTAITHWFPWNERDAFEIAAGDGARYGFTYEFGNERDRLAPGSFVEWRRL